MRLLSLRAGRAEYRICAPSGAKWREISSHRFLGIDDGKKLAYSSEIRTTLFFEGMMADETRTKPYTVEELSEAGRVSDAYIRRLLRDGRITGQKFGGVWMVSAESGRAWLNERRRKTE